MDTIILLVFGIIFIILGAFNIKGNISSIKWYNRQKVSKEDTKKYGQIMGTGMLIMGISFIPTAILLRIFENENLWYPVVGGIVVGLIFMIYGQIKYNKGIL